MQKYVKTYLDYFDYWPTDFIPCEVCWRQSVDIHHIKFKSQIGQDCIWNLIGICRPCHDRWHLKKRPYLTQEDLQLIHNKFIWTCKIA